MKYCTKCGKELVDEAVICTGCGCSVAPQGNDFNNAPTDPQALIGELSKKVQVNAIIWIVIAAIQLLLGLTINWVLLIVGVLNLISGITDINFSKTVLTKPVGILKKYESLTGPIITLIYNLIFGGVIGVAGSIYWLVAIRQFVIKNKETFIQIEETYIPGA